MGNNNFNKGKNRLREAYKRLAGKYECGSRLEDVERVSEHFGQFSHDNVYDDVNSGYRNSDFDDDLSPFYGDDDFDEASYQDENNIEEMHNQNMTAILQIIDDCKRKCQAQRRTDRGFLIEQVINAVCNLEEIFVNDDVIEKIFEIFDEGEKESALEGLCLREKIPGMDYMSMILPEQIEVLAEAYKRCGFTFDTLPDIMLTDTTFMTTYFKTTSMEPMDIEKRMVEEVNLLCAKNREI